MKYFQRSIVAILTFGLGAAAAALFPPAPNLRPASDAPDIFENVLFDDLVNNKERFDGRRIRTTVRKIGAGGDVGIELFGPEGGDRTIVGVCRVDENCGELLASPELVSEGREIIVTGVFRKKSVSCGIAPNGLIGIYEIAPADSREAVTSVK
jgi:hypothetical protein